MFQVSASGGMSLFCSARALRVKPKSRFESRHSRNLCWILGSCVPRNIKAQSRMLLEVLCCFELGGLHN